MTPRPLTLAEAIRDSAASGPGRTALILDEDTCSFAEFAAGAERRARQILALGAGKGDRVGILLPNGLDYLELVAGAAMLGVILVPMNVRFKALELRHLILDSGMTALITIGAIPDVVDFTALLREALTDLPAGAWHGLALDAAPRLKIIARLDQPMAEHAGALPTAPVEPSDPLLLMYTSGTTASPKGCVISNRGLMANCWAIIDRFSLTADDLWWCPLPMFHIGGLLFPAMMLAAGGTHAGMRHFEPEGAIEMLRRHPPTIFYPLFPTITLAVIEHPRFAEAEFSRLKMLCNVAPEELQQRIQAAVPQAPLIGAFGMTEASGTAVYGSLSDSAAKRLATCGTPLAGWQIRILDSETHAPLPAGERGELAIRGEALFDRYWNDPELTAQQFTPDGFFLTGDVGSIDMDGFLSFHGRFKDQLKVGGENVSALEVESFLATHPAIQLAQVVGTPDARYGEIPVAFVQLKPGQALDEPALLEFCSGKIARFKVPRHIRFVEEWPMSATKILKYRLRDSFDAERAEAPLL
ncbi:MAG: AMP-dependent synthetase [Sphingomonadales bacterium]|nr:MAG: AMP-dependent synthetase [Sphingomonadales bacterium]